MSRVPLLSVEDLSVNFRTRSGTVKALEGINLAVARGEILGVVGESGSGKSVTAFTIMGLLDRAGEVTQGSIHFGGTDMLNAPERELQELRGRELTMIFQSPRTSLNPIRPVGVQIVDVLRRHAAITRRELRQQAIEALAAVRIPDPQARFHAYPFELSGGQCQRVMIAMALACRPSLLIADEPTTGLDVTTQAVIMDLIRDLAHERRMATVLITHDLHLAAQVCDHIAVMHAGHVVETAPTERLFREARHPYTARLIAATPAGHGRLEEIQSIPGNLPDLRAPQLPSCRFSRRCERFETICEAPLALDTVAEDHTVRCRRPL